MHCTYDLASSENLCIYILIRPLKDFIDLRNQSVYLSFKQSNVSSFHYMPHKHSGSQVVVPVVNKLLYIESIAKGP